MTKLSAHIFPVHAYREQKRYMRRFLKKPKDCTVREFFSRVQEINNYLQVFPSETVDPSTPLPEEELVEALYHAMPNSWRTEMVIQGFNYVHHNCMELLNFCERLETLEPPPEKKKDNKKSSKNLLARLVTESANALVFSPRPKTKDLVSTVCCTDIANTRLTNVKI